MRLLLLLTNIFAISTYCLAAPVDYSGDSISDPSSVTIGDSLSWHSLINGDDSVITQSFGQVGQHLAPGQYQDSTTTIPATIDSDGNWEIEDMGNVQFGDSSSLFLAGADLDGDGKTDLAFSSYACESKRSHFNVRLNPLSSNAVEHSFKGNRGNYYKFYMDSDGDNVDEVCSLAPIKINKEITKKFKAVCKSAITQKRVKTIKVGVVNGQPVPVKIAGQADLLLIPKRNATKTKLKFINNDGNTVSKVIFERTGEILVGNFSSTTNQQVAIVNDSKALLYDVASETSSEINFPDGIPYDQINIVHFQDNDDCFCTSRRISRYDTCAAVAEPIEIPEDTPTQISVPDNCSNPPEHISSGDGFKCIASATRGGSVVCLLPYQFTWAPHKSVTDHHNYTFACNKNDTSFDDVTLVLKSGERIGMEYAGCHNYVATPDGSIGRQHFRNEGITWNSIENKVSTIEMIKGSQKTCLKF